MSFHVRDDFRERGPVSQVPASWFNKVAQFLNNLVGGYGITLTKNDKGASVIEVDQSAIPAPTSRATGTPLDATDAPAVYDQAGATASWSAGSANGLLLDCYCKIAPQSSGSNYSVFQRCRLTISCDGLVVNAQMLADRIRIQAKNG